MGWWVLLLLWSMAWQFFRVLQLHVNGHQLLSPTLLSSQFLYSINLPHLYWGTSCSKFSLDAYRALVLFYGWSKVMGKHSYFNCSPVGRLSFRVAPRSVTGSKKLQLVFCLWCLGIVHANLQYQMPHKAFYSYLLGSSMPLSGTLFRDHLLISSRCIIPVLQKGDVSSEKNPS